MIRFQRLRSHAIGALVGAIVIVVAIPVGVMAAHRFVDVPDSNQFHDDIGWLADNRVTLGCNAPANDRYCPSDNVTRQQMAAFMRRLARTSGTVGSQVTDFNSSIPVNSSAWVELLSVEAGAVSNASVTLAAHVYLERPANENQRYRVMIARTDCAGTPVGVGWWRPDNSDGGFEADTIAVSGSDTVEAKTTYVLCASKFSNGGPDITAHMRGLTATWSPTT